MVSHPVILRGLGATTTRAAPLVVARTDDDFVDRILDELGQPGLAALLASRAQDHDDNGTLRLFQPVHRVHHLALFEVVCDRVGQPRLDPAELAGAGLVIRRVAASRPVGAFGQGWLTADGKARGWTRFPSLAAAEVDPDPARRRLADQGQPAINARLREVLLGDEVAEQVVTLHVAPPAVCAAAGRTVLFGLIPTASSELEPPAADAASPYDPDEITAAVPRYLRAGKAASISGLAGRWFTYEQADELAADTAASGDREPRASDDSQRRASKQMFGLLELLRTLAIQLDAFESKAAAPLRKQLAAVRLRFAGDRFRPADEFLADAAEALVMSPGSGKAVLMPEAWPAWPVTTAAAIRGAFGDLLQARFAAFTPRATRFDDPEARYQLRGFVRVRRADGCPPRLTWSPPSAPYRVMPWYEPGAGPPTLVRLPPLDRKNIRKLKPNVAFVVPKGLFCLLGRNKPKDFLDGKGKECTPSMLQGGLDWVCGFNIPIITLCAFIVLYIFLTLFNIIFWWLPFIRICFPLPRKAKELAP